MSVTLSEVLTNVAYRLGENNSPTDSSEKARRINDINSAYRKVILHRNYWFMEDTDSDTSTVSGTASYSLPTDYKDIISLKVGDNYYTFVPELAVKNEYDKNNFPYLNYGDSYEWGMNRNFAIYGNEYTLYPTPSSADTVTVRYYSYPEKVSADSDTFIIPDFYVDCLEAYAYARIMGRKGLDKEMNDGMEEFNSVLQSMDVDDTKRAFTRKSVRPLSPYSLIS